MSTTVKTLSGILVKQDGTPRHVTIEAGWKGTAKAIGANTIDVVRLPDNVDMWVDDDGMYTRGVNPMGTSIAWTLMQQEAQEFYGDVLFLSVDPETGESISLGDDEAEVITSIGLAVLVARLRDAFDMEEDGEL